MFANNAVVSKIPGALTSTLNATGMVDAALILNAPNGTTDAVVLNVAMPPGLNRGIAVVMAVVVSTVNGVSQTSFGQLSQVSSSPSQVATGQSSQAVVAKKSQLYSP